MTALSRVAPFALGVPVCAETGNLGREALHDARRWTQNTGRCAWCGRNFRPRTTGGHAQRFCRPPCRRAYDAAGRRWVAAALADGSLTVEALKSRYSATRALFPGAVSPPPILAPAEGPDEAVELLDKLASVLFAAPDLLPWLEATGKLSAPLSARLHAWRRDRMKPENRPRFPSRRA
jgi:hypothetical protein